MRVKKTNFIFDFSNDGHSIKEKTLLLDAHPVVAKLLSEAFRALYGHRTKESQDQAWRCLRKLTIFLSEADLSTASTLPADINLTFYDWLATKPLQGSSKQTVGNLIKGVLEWCARNRPFLFNAPFKFESRSFKRSQPLQARKALDLELSSRIMKCALNEIDVVENRLVQGRAMIAACEGENAALIVKLLELGNGRFPNHNQLSKSGDNLFRRVANAGGLRNLWSMVFTRPADLLPFYLAIQFQTAGNPYAIAALTRDCVRQHPIREDRETIVWSKPRANKMQRSDFPAKKFYSAPSLVRRLLVLTEPLRPLTRINKERLFICYTGGKVTTPSVQTWHNELALFLKKYDLPDFDFVQLRRTSAVLHHQQGESIFIAKNKLNHKSVLSTLKYTTLADRESEHDLLIAKGQAALYQEVVRREKVEAPKESIKEAADTIFGFQCRNPLDGFGGYGGATGACDHFFRCATCPGSLVMLDNPDVVARLLSSKIWLEDAKESFLRDGRHDRFLALYQPTLDVISNKLLPNVAQHIKEKAQSISVFRSFPPLE